MKVTFNFGGFYSSQHSDIVDSMLDNYFEDEEGCEYPNDNINYRLIYETYSQVLCEKFGGFLGVNLEFVELISPREYNFTTDKIEVEISDQDALKLLDQVSLGALEEMALDCSTVKDGYIPFYTYEELLYDLERRVELSLEILWAELDRDILMIMWQSEFIYNLNFIENN